MTPPTTTVHDLPGLLAAAPALVGFTPHDSIVAITVHDPRRQLGLVMRVDRPRRTADQHCVVDYIDTTLRRHEPDGVIIMAFGADGAETISLLPVLMHLQATMARSTEVVAVGWTDGHRWVEIGPDGPFEEGVMATEQTSAAVAAAIVAGHEILGSRDEVEAQYAPVSGPTRTRMVAAADAAAHTLSHSLLEADPVSVVLRRIDPILAHALDGGGLTDGEVALVSLALAHHEVSDEIFSRVTTDTARDWSRVWAEVSRRVVPPVEAPVLAFAAYAAWLTGDGARALIAAERACAADPQHRPAQLMLDLISRGVPPPSWEARHSG